MKTFLIIFVILLFSIRSFSQVNSNDLLKVWYLSGWYDPYNITSKMDKLKNPKFEDGIIFYDTLKSMRTIQFFENGEYVETDPWNLRKGNWKLSPDSTKIGMIPFIINDTINPGRQVEVFQFDIFKLKKDSLTLGQMGPHGTLLSFYLPRNNN